MMFWSWATIAGMVNPAWGNVERVHGHRRQLNAGHMLEPQRRRVGVASEARCLERRRRERVGMRGDDEAWGIRRRLGRLRVGVKERRCRRRLAGG